MPHVVFLMVRILMIAFWGALSKFHEQCVWCLCFWVVKDSWLIWVFWAMKWCNMMIWDGYESGFWRNFGFKTLLRHITKRIQIKFWRWNSWVLKNWTVSCFKRQRDSNPRKRDSNRLLIILKFLGFCKGIRILEKRIWIAWRCFSYWKLDSNRLKIFWPLENRFESLEEGFESLENFLATGNRLRILERGIRIA